MATIDRSQLNELEGHFDRIVALFGDLKNTVDASESMPAESYEAHVKELRQELKEAKDVADALPEHGERLEEQSLLNAFLQGAGSVLEFFPSSQRLDKWRLTHDTSITEWPVVMRNLLAELRVQSSDNEVHS